MIKFKATPDQIRQIGVNAVKASSAMGLGILHYNQKDNFTIDQLPPPGNDFYLDYVAGRMVKLYIMKRGDHWETRATIDPDYQSWCREYPTMMDLLSSVDGVEILEEGLDDE